MHARIGAKHALMPQAAALAIGSIALLMLGLQPILLGELVERRVIGMEGVGALAMGEIIALGLGVVLGDTLLPINRYRIVAVLAALCLAAIDAATARAGGESVLLGLRAAAGGAEGVLVWVTISVIVRSAQPDRLAAVFMLVQTLSQAVLAALLADWIIPAGGWPAGFLLLTGVTLFVCALAGFLPRRLGALPLPQAAASLRSRGALGVLAVSFLQLAAIGALWAYLEPLGTAAGLDSRASQRVISAVLVMQMLGGAVAIVTVRRLRPGLVLGVCSLVMAAISLTVRLVSGGNSTVFAVAVGLFGFIWLFLMPFQIGLSFKADASGRVAQLVPAAQLLGSACGPLVASLLVHDEEVGNVAAVCAAFALSAAAVLAMRGRAPAGVAVANE